MKRSLKTLVACAAFAICLCATTISSFAAPDLKIDPVALIAYAQAAAAEDGTSVTGTELFIDPEAGNYTFADVAASLDEYGLAYEVTDDAAYLIGNAVKLGTAGTMADPILGSAAYSYSIVGDGYPAILATIATKNAEEVVSVVMAGASDVAENGLPQIPDEVTDTLDDIYAGMIGVVPDIVSDIQEQAPTVIAGVVGAVTEGYSDVIDQAGEALADISPEEAQDFLDSAFDDVATTVGTVIDDVAGAIGDVDPDAALANLWAFFFS